MQTGYETRNVPAAILFFALVVINIAIRLTNFLTLGGSLVGVGFFRFAFGSPLAIIYLLALVAAGVLLLMEQRPGAAGCLFAIGAVCLIWTGQGLQYLYGPMVLIDSVLPSLLETAAFILAGVMVIAPEKFPHSPLLVALPCILLAVTALLPFVSFVASLFNGYGMSVAPMLLRMVLLLGEHVCAALALLFACRWAMGKYLPAPAPARAAAGGMTAGAAAMPTWFCPNCGRAGNTGMFCGGCGTKVPERLVAEAQAAGAGQAVTQASGATASGYAQPTAGQPLPYGQANPLDTGSFGWAVLGFFVPLVGLILWIVWKSDRPKSARKAGIGALVSVLAEVIVGIIVIIFVAALGASVMSYY